MALCLLLTFPVSAEAHPLHTTMTEITLDPSRRVMRVMIRAFSEDFLKAVATARRPASVPTVDGADATAYIRKAFVMLDAGRAVSFRSCGTRRSADLVWICLETEVPRDLSRTRLHNALLWELFEDQVNIIQSRAGTSPHSILFTKGDRPKPLL